MIKNYLFGILFLSILSTRAFIRRSSSDDSDDDDFDFGTGVISLTSSAPGLDCADANALEIGVCAQSVSFR